jgi:hypothetical protein
MKPLRPLLAGAATIAVLAGCGGSPGLIGTFLISPGRCDRTSVTGSYFRIIKPGGSIAAGKFFDNPRSACQDKTYTPVRPGTAGGLVTGSFQPDPRPAFDSTGHPRAKAIISPVAFLGSTLAISTNLTDPQTGVRTSPPVIRAVTGKLSGQLDPWSAEWSRQYFNQGSPRPGGSPPGANQPVAGTYDATTRAYVLTWSSQMLGYPFNGFTVYWHLEGRFTPRK